MRPVIPPSEQKGLKRDSAKLGILLGLLVPAIFFLCLWLADQFFATRLDKEYMIKDGTKLVIGVAVNVLLFRWYMVKMRFDQTGKGILAATFFYAIFYMIFFVMLDKTLLF